MEVRCQQQEKEKEKEKEFYKDTSELPNGKIVEVEYS